MSQKPFEVRVRGEGRANISLKLRFPMGTLATPLAPAIHCKKMENKENPRLNYDHRIIFMPSAVYVYLKVVIFVMSVCE